MGLFKDFKEDFSQAVNELVPGGEMDETIADDVVVDTLGESVDVKSELSKLDGLLEQVKEEAPAKAEHVAPVERKVEERKPVDNRPVVADETSVITASTVLTGNLASAGSFDIQGTVNGNVACNGKLVVTGVINGNSSASEFFADAAKIEGEVVSSGTVKVGAGSVIIGNITAASAVVMGNIKSRSVQINNGAVIEGFCSQCYADIDVQGLFGSRL